MAATFTTSCTFTEMIPNAGYKEIVVISPTVMVASDIITVTLADYGISLSGLLTVTGFCHTTNANVIVVDQPTTTVSAGVLSMTAPTRVPTAYKRVYRIVGKSA